MQLTLGAEHRQMTNAILRHDAHGFGHARIRRYGDRIARHHLHHERFGRALFMHDAPKHVALTDHADDLTQRREHDERAHVVSSHAIDCSAHRGLWHHRVDLVALVEQYV